MKILVAIKRVLEPSVKPRIKADGSAMDLANCKMSMNPFDEIAVEEAVRLKEAGIATEIVVMTVDDSPKAQETLRQALAMGADRAIHVNRPQAPPITTSKIIKAVIDKEQPEISLFGKLSIDWDHSQTGQMVATRANLPMATFASKIEVVDNKATVTREVDGGLETITIALPGVITVDLRLNEPRYVKLPNIMKAKKKPLDVLTDADLGITEEESILKLITIEKPAERQKGETVPDVDTLISKLKEKGVL